MSFKLVKTFVLSVGSYRSSVVLPSFSVRVQPFRSGERFIQPIGGGASLHRSAGADAIPLTAVDSFMMESTQPCIDVGSNDELLMVVRCAAPEVALFRLDGTVQWRRRLDLPSPTRDKVELNRLRERFVERMIRDGVSGELAAMTAAKVIGNYDAPRIFSKPVIMSNGILIFLEQLEDELDPTSAVLHVVPSREGSPARIDLPWRVVDISAGTDSTVLMISEDPETGERRVGVYRLKSVQGR